MPNGLTKATLSDAELAHLVQSVGFSSTRKHRNYREDATAVAIILAESEGDANAHNDNPATRDDSYGLFQINMYGDLKAERAQRYGLRSTANLFEPKRNAEIAFDIFRRAGFKFTDWSTYNNVTYLRHIPRALRAVQAPAEGIPTLESGLGSAIGGIVPDPIKDLATAMTFITDPDNWRRVAMFVGGGGLIIAATVLFVIESGIGKSAIKAVPGGRAVTGAARGATKVARTVRKG